MRRLLLLPAAIVTLTLAGMFGHPAPAFADGGRGGGCGQYACGFGTGSGSQGGGSGGGVSLVNSPGESHWQVNGGYGGPGGGGSFHYP
jgi:hypothetical protein